MFPFFGARLKSLYYLTHFSLQVHFFLQEIHFIHFSRGTPQQNRPNGNLALKGLAEKIRFSQKKSTKMARALLEYIVKFRDRKKPGLERKKVL
jgi:hypothetical protein